MPDDPQTTKTPAPCETIGLKQIPSGTGVGAPVGVPAQGFPGARGKVHLAKPWEFAGAGVFVFASTTNSSNSPTTTSENVDAFQYRSLTVPGPPLNLTPKPPFNTLGERSYAFVVVLYVIKLIYPPLPGTDGEQRILLNFPPIMYSLVPGNNAIELQYPWSPNPLKPSAVPTLAEGRLKAFIFIVF